MSLMSCYKANTHVSTIQVKKQNFVSHRLPPTPFHKLPQYLIPT